MKKLLLGVFLAVSMVEASWAAPTVQIKGGQTNLIFESPMTDELLFAGVEMVELDGDLEARETDEARPQERRKLRLRVRDGLIDLRGLAGEINHRGGVRLESSTGVAASLQAFRIDSMGEVPYVSAIAVLGGDLIDRFNLFELRITDNTQVKLNDRHTTLGVRGAELFLTEAGARIINEFYDTDFEAGLRVGKANIGLKLRRHRPNTDDNSGSDRDGDRDDRDDDDSDDDDGRGSDDDSDSDDNDSGLALG